MKNSALMRGGELEKYIGELEEKVKTYSEEYELLRKENRELKNELMEDMKTETALNNIIKHYKEENKKLKDKIAKLEFDIHARTELKKVKEIENAKLLGERDGLLRAVEGLKEEIRFLKKCDDRGWKPASKSEIDRIIQNY